MDAELLSKVLPESDQMASQVVSDLSDVVEFDCCCVCIETFLHFYDEAVLIVTDNIFMVFNNF